jgi:hypothetical protein
MGAGFRILGSDWARRALAMAHLPAANAEQVAETEGLSD